MTRPLLLPVSGAQLGFNIDDIIRVDSANGHSYIFSEDKREEKGWNCKEINCPLCDIQQMLPGDDFEQVSKSTIISYKYFESLQERCVIKLKVKCGGVILLGRKYRDAFLMHFKR